MIAASLSDAVVASVPQEGRTLNLKDTAARIRVTRYRILFIPLTAIVRCVCKTQRTMAVRGMNRMRYRVTRILAALSLAWCSSVFGAEATTASLKEAAIVTEVLEWGETVTALRLEYSDEIDCRAVEHSNEHPGRMTYNLVNDRSIANVYVNNSGRKDDVGLHGRFVFINLALKNADATTYRDQVTFNTSSKHRDKLSAFYGFQSEPVMTRSGKVIAPNRFMTSREIAAGVDDFTTFTFRNEDQPRAQLSSLHSEGLRGRQRWRREAAAGRPLSLWRLLLYRRPGQVPRRAVYASRCALLGNRRGPGQQPGIRVTSVVPPTAAGTLTSARSEMQQNYLQVIRKILGDYRVDPSRIYAISLAGGSVPMWHTILANPDLFAAQISTAYDPYHAFKDLKLAEANFAAMLKSMPGWFFAGLTDGSGFGSLGPNHTRLKGERLRDIAALMNQRGMNLDVGFGQEGELMWNGLLRGAKAEQLATTQPAREVAQGQSPGYALHPRHDRADHALVMECDLFERRGAQLAVPAGQRRAVRHFALALHQVQLDVFVADVVGLDVGVDQAAPAVEKPAAQHVTAGETPEWIDDDPGDARALAGAVQRFRHQRGITAHALPLIAEVAVKESAPGRHRGPLPDSSRGWSRGSRSRGSHRVAGRTVA